MSSILERLFATATVIVTPLLAAAATPKKTGKQAKVKSKSARPKQEKKARARPVKKSGKPTSSRAAKSDRANARQKEQVPPATKTAEPRTPRPAPGPKPAPPTGRALQLAPENGKYADSIHPKFRWLSVGGATRYELQWSERPDFDDAQNVISVATGWEVPVEKPLRVGATYFWRVRGGNEGGWGPWSPALSFQVLEEPPAP